MLTEPLLNRVALPHPETGEYHERKDHPAYHNNGFGYSGDRAVYKTNNWNAGKYMEPPDDLSFGCCFHNNAIYTWLYIPDSALLSFGKMHAEELHPRSAVL